MLGMAAALVLGPWVAGAGAQSVLTPMEAFRHHYPAASGVIDEPVEMAHWTEDAQHKWVYVAGWMSVPQASGSPAIVMAVARYDAFNMNGGEPAKIAYYPAAPSSSMGAVVYKATGLVVDPENGDVYICGEGTGLTGTMDYYVIKYEKDLTQYSSLETGYWASAGDGDNIRRYDSTRADRPVDIIVGGSGSAKRVVVTGSTQTESNGKDFYTIWYNANDGTTGNFARQVNHSSNGDDIPVELCAWEVDENNGEMPAGFYIGVAGTSYDSSTGRDMMLVQYNPSGTETWRERFNPEGDDICTGIAPAKQLLSGGAGVVAICGSTTVDPAAPTDTAYATVAFEVDGDRYEEWADGVEGVYRSARLWNPGENEDTAVDVAQASGPFWVSGTTTVDADLGRDAGTICYAAADGDVIGSDIFNYSADPGSDEIVAQVQSSGDVAWVMGSWYDTTNSPTIWRYLVLSYTTASPFGLAAYGSYDAGNDMENTGKAITVFFNFGGAGAHRLFTTGRSGDVTTGLDWVTLRY